MPNQNVTDTIAKITRATTVIKGATIFANSVPSRIDAAVQAALANGATAAELEPLTALSAEFSAETDTLEAALLANTPGTA